jgi:hypothetical protein
MTTATEYDVVKVGRALVGRRDAGWAIEVDEVQVDGEPFVRIHKRGEAEPTFYSPCGRCADWSGTIAAFGHVYGGTCFECGGQGCRDGIYGEAGVVKRIKRRKSDRARAARKESARWEAMAATREVWAKANPEVAADLAVIYEGIASEAAYHATCERYGDFVTSMANQAMIRGLSEAQTEAVATAMVKIHAREVAAAEKVAASRHYGTVGDKVTVTGVATVVTRLEDHYRHNGPRKAMVVVTGTGEFEGVVVKMIGTGATLYDVGRGDTVTVTGAVKGHDDFQGVRQTVLIRAKAVVNQPAE